MGSEDQLIAQLWREERAERRELYRQFYQASDDYLERMSGLEGGRYHDLSSDISEGGVAVVQRNTPNTGVGPHLFISSFTETQSENGLVEKSLRNFAIARHHRALRWRFATEVIRPSSGLKMESTDEGPTTYGVRYFGSRQRRLSSDMDINAQATFNPVLHWHPQQFEQFKVRHVLKEALGIIATLGFEEGRPLDGEDRHKLHIPSQ